MPIPKFHVFRVHLQKEKEIRVIKRFKPIVISLLLILATSYLIINFSTRQNAVTQNQPTITQSTPHTEERENLNEALSFSPTPDPLPTPGNSQSHPLEPEKNPLSSLPMGEKLTEPTKQNELPASSNKYHEKTTTNLLNEIPNAFPVNNAQAYFVAPEDRYPGHLGGPPPLQLPKQSTTQVEAPSPHTN